MGNQRIAPVQASTGRNAELWYSRRDFWQACSRNPKHAARSRLLRQIARQCRRPVDRHVCRPSTCPMGPLPWWAAYVCVFS